MEDVDHVVGHTLLCHNHFFAAIDYKVATLVIAAVFTIFHPLVLIQILQLAKVAPQHNGHFADKDASIVLLEDDSLDFSLSLACLWTVIKVILKFFFAKLDICIEFSSVGKVSHASFVREYGLHTVV